MLTYLIELLVTLIFMLLVRHYHVLYVREQWCMRSDELLE